MEPRTRTLVFWSAAALIAVETLLFGLVVPALPDFAERFALSDTAAAILFALFPIGQLMTAVLGGAALERTGRRPAMIASVVLMAVATAGFAFADSVALLALARFLQGAAAGLAWTAALAMISDIYPASQLGYRMSLAEAIGGAGGGLAGPVVGGIGFDTIGVRPTFLIAAAVPALVALPILLTPETRRPRVGKSVARRTALVRVMGQPRARVAIAALIVFAVVLSLLEPLLPLDLDRRLELSATAIGVVFAMLILADLITAPLAGRWSDARGRIGPMILGGALLTVALPLTAFGPLPAVLGAVAVVGVGLGAMGAGIGALMTQAVDDAGLAGEYGLSAGILSALFSVGSLAGPLLGGLSRAALPFSATVTLLAVAVAGATIWMVSALRAVERQESVQEGLGGP